MKSKLVKIGNSRGIRIARPLLEEAGLTDEVEIRAEAGALIITAVESPRAGWAEAAARVKPTGMLDAQSPTRFDDEEWAW